MTFRCVCILACVFKAFALSDQDHEAIVQRVIALEAKERMYGDEIALLKELTKHQLSRLDSQEKMIQSLRNELNMFKTKPIQGSFISKGDDTRTDTPQEKTKRESKSFKDKRMLNKRPTEGVAFTAYLDHRVVFGQSQTIKFNKVVTNEGNGYSIHTGSFTCPVSGMYLFTVVLAEQGIAADLTADIVVNSQKMLDVVVDPYHDSQDIMGSNTLVVRLNQGDAVWVAARTAGSHTDSSNSYRRTTFTGVYLFS